MFVAGQLRIREVFLVAGAAGTELSGSNGDTQHSKQCPCWGLRRLRIQKVSSVASAESFGEAMANPESFFCGANMMKGKVHESDCVCHVKEVCFDGQVDVVACRTPQTKLQHTRKKTWRAFSVGVEWTALIMYVYYFLSQLDNNWAIVFAPFRDSHYYIPVG